MQIKEKIVACTGVVVIMFSAHLWAFDPETQVQREDVKRLAEVIVRLSDKAGSGVPGKAETLLKPLASKGNVEAVL